jgi:hypothetical protein
LLSRAESSGSGAFTLRGWVWASRVTTDQLLKMGKEGCDEQASTLFVRDTCTFSYDDR